jgi:hypothetical protein
MVRSKSETDAPAAGDANAQRPTIPDRAFVEAQILKVRPECDRPESPEDSIEVRMGRGLKHPKDKGYSRFLTSLGYDRNSAGMLAAKIVEEGRVRAATSKKNSEFAQALRRLANPRLETDAYIADCKAALEAMDGTSLTRALFDELPTFHGFLFLKELRFCLAGDLSGRAEVVRIAKAIWRRVFVSRGPKLTHASAAHEYFLESLSPFKSGSFTWSPSEEDFTDILTKATREEFDDPDFEPRSSQRRLRAKGAPGRPSS